MTHMPRVMVVYGTRPEAIKLAPVILALRADPRFATTVVVTGQHGRILDEVNEFFGIVPDADLDVMKQGQSLTELSATMFARLLETFAAQRPDAVLMHGDTTSSALAALAAYYQGIPVIHLEAGLRSGDLASPFPEEGNRRIAGQLAALHLAPTPGAAANLLAENLDPARIVVTGNTVIDALLHTVGKHAPFTDKRLTALLCEERPIVLVTAHRRESWGGGLERTARALARVAHAHPEIAIVLPLHPNPTVHAAIEPVLGSVPQAILTEPLDYPQFCRLLNASHIVVTDSGGVQEEAPALGKPVLVTRDTTERPEAIEAGIARLVGTSEHALGSALSELLEDRAAYERMAHSASPYGDGLATERAVAAIAHHFGLGTRLADFVPRQGALRPALPESSAWELQPSV